MSISDRIKELRISNHLTQDDVAQACYVTRCTVSNWEAGRRLPDIDTIVLLSRLFNVSVNELLGNEELKNVKVENFKNQINEIKTSTEKVSMFKGIILLILIAVLAILVPLNYKENEGEYETSHYLPGAETSYILNVHCGGKVRMYNFKEINLTTLSHTTTNFKITVNTYEVQEAYVVEDVDLKLTTEKDEVKYPKIFVEILSSELFASNVNLELISSNYNYIYSDKNNVNYYLPEEGIYDFLLFTIDDFYYIGAFLVN